VPDFARPSPASIVPVTLETLGAVSLRDAAGAPLPTILRQPKRIALLSYLALGSIGTYVRRDSLLAMFWPELDESHARNALNKSVHHLRQALGEGVLVRRIQRRLQGGYLIACDNPTIATETVDRLGSHSDASRSAPELAVLGRVAAAIQKL